MKRLKELYGMIEDNSVVVAVVGLGYVGMPLAVAFSDHFDTIGFDINEEKVALFKKGVDMTHEVGDERLQQAKIELTCNKEDLKRADIFVVAVPTPIDDSRTPDFKPLIGASNLVGEVMKSGSLVIYESTVYPGATEEVCVPILEEKSGFKHGQAFFVGYSPERINPSDKVHRLETIVKVVSACCDEALDVVDSLYSRIIAAGVHRASSIKVGEAAKVIENSQRDINIAFVNEISMIFDKMGIDTSEVLKAAGTKWNFLNFTPGLVGGHCIGVDPYYLAYKAQMMGHYPQIILSGRRINDGMGSHVAAQTVKKLIAAGCSVKGAKALIMGFTFKENVPDCRNTKVVDIIHELQSFGVEVMVHDPYAIQEEAQHEYGVQLVDSIEDALPVEAVIVAVGHDEYKAITLEKLKSYMSDKGNVLIDIKGVYDKYEAEDQGLVYWRL